MRQSLMHNPKITVYRVREHLLATASDGGTVSIVEDRGTSALVDYLGPDLERRELLSVEVLEAYPQMTQKEEELLALSKEIQEARKEEP